MSKNIKMRIVCNLIYPFHSINCDVVPSKNNNCLSYVIGTSTTMW